jgi:hypothetical protein
VSLTPVANEKNLNQKNFNNFVGTPLDSRDNIFAFKFTLRYLQPDINPTVCTGVNDTGGKFAAGVVDIGGNLPPVLFTPAANLPPLSLTPVANLPPVSLIPVVNLELRLSP